MSSYANHQALAGLTLGKSTDYRDTYDASLLQGVPRSLNRDPLGLKADNLPFHGTDICDLLRQLSIPESEARIIFVNGIGVEKDALLHDGDRVGIFPPVGGG